MDKAKIVRYAKIAAGAVIAILIVIVVAKNFEYIEADFLLISIRMPLALLILVTFLLGAGFGFLAGSFHIRRRLRKDEGEKKKEAG